MRFYTNVQLIRNVIHYRGYNNGSPELYKENFTPTLYIPSKVSSQYKTLDGQYVSPIVFDSARDAGDFIRKYDGVDNFKVHGYERFLYQYIGEKYPEEDILFDMSVMNIISMDIEVACDNGFPDVNTAEGEILCITIKDMNTKKFIVWGTREYDNTRTDLEYRVFWTERELLLSFLSWWIQNTPDVVTGWNCDLYDVPYIMRRMERVLGEKQAKSMSPWNIVSSKEINIMGRDQTRYTLSGITILDYLDLYKKFIMTTRSSYRLDYIASVELGDAKLDHSEYENFKDFYTNNWQKFVDYNIHDTELIDRLDSKLKLIELAITMAYGAKQNYEDVYSQVKTWDNITYNYLKAKNIAVPPRTVNTKDYSYAGAYVKDPIVGKHNYVVNFDLNSMYPHLIMQFGISPETLVDERHPTVTVDKILNQELTFELYSDYAVCPNGAMYRKDVRGFLPELMEKMYNYRVVYKDMMIKEKKELEQIESEMKKRKLL